MEAKYDGGGGNNWSWYMCQWYFSSRNHFCFSFYTVHMQSFLFLFYVVRETF